MIRNVTSPPFVHVEFKTRGHNCPTLDGKTNLFRILTLEAFRKCTLLYTSDLNLLRFMGLNVKWAVFRKNTDVTQLHPRLKNMTSYDKRAIFDLLFTFSSHQGRVTKVPSAHISLTYIHVFCLPYWLFCLVNQFWKKKYQFIRFWHHSWCWFLFAPFWKITINIKMVSKI